MCAISPPGRPRLKATLTEALRLHPSVPLDFKTALKDDTLPDGTKILCVVPPGPPPLLWGEAEETAPTDSHTTTHLAPFQFSSIQ